MNRNYGFRLDKWDEHESVRQYRLHLERLQNTRPTSKTNASTFMDMQCPKVFRQYKEQGPKPNLNKLYEKERIDSNNRLLGERISQIKERRSLVVLPSKPGFIIRRDEVGKRGRLKSKLIKAQNVKIFKRIVNVKPFCERSTWAKEREKVEEHINRYRKRIGPSTRFQISHALKKQLTKEHKIKHETEIVKKSPNQSSHSQESFLNTENLFEAKGPLCTDYMVSNAEYIKPSKAETRQQANKDVSEWTFEDRAKLLDKKYMKEIKKVKEIFKETIAPRQRKTLKMSPRSNRLRQTKTKDSNIREPHPPKDFESFLRERKKNESSSSKTNLTQKRKKRKHRLKQNQKRSLHSRYRQPLDKTHDKNKIIHAKKVTSQSPDADELENRKASVIQKKMRQYLNEKENKRRHTAAVKIQQKLTNFSSENRRRQTAAVTIQRRLKRFSQVKNKESVKLSEGISPVKDAHERKSRTTQKKVKDVRTNPTANRMNNKSVNSGSTSKLGNKQSVKGTKKLKNKRPVGERPKRNGVKAKATYKESKDRSDRLRNSKGEKLQQEQKSHEEILRKASKSLAKKTIYSLYETAFRAYIKRLDLKKA